MIFLAESVPKAVPMREIFWNVPGWVEPVLFFVFVPILLAVFLYGFWRRYQLWRMGQPEREKRLDQIGKRIKLTLKGVFASKTMYNDMWAGIIHGLIFFGFFILFFFGAVLDAINLHIGEHLLGTHLIQGVPYLIQSFILEIAGFMLLFGVILAAIRRYIVRPAHLEQSAEAGIILLALFLVCLTGFAVEGFRLGADEPQWAAWSIGGKISADIFSGMGVTKDLMFGSHMLMWWIHMLLSFGLVAYIAWSKLRHMCTSAANIFLQSLRPRGEVPIIEDIEEQERWGNSKIEHFTWKQLLDLDACTRCGRCEANCPAHLTEKPLNPKKIIGDMKGRMETIPSLPKPKEGENVEEFDDGRTPLVGGVIEDEALWACTGCLACLGHCPVEIPVADKIIDMRRHLVLMESRFPKEAQAAFEGMENNSNPYKIGNDTRLDFLKDVEDVKVFSELEEGERPDLCYFAGCSASFDPRNQKVAIAFIRLLKKAGVDFAMLGPEENCCGDSARRLGNEYLSQSLVRMNIETFGNYGIKKIVTACSHGYNMLKNEYQQFGVEIEVISHVELLQQLISEGRLKPVKPVEGKILYHDSCCLGRYNGIYDAPRDIMYAIPGLRPAEFERNREHSFCCGGGGGRMWLDETIGKNINEVRTQEALDEEPKMIATACPFCMTMFEDGLKAKEAEEKVKAIDLCELLLQSVE